MIHLRLDMIYKERFMAHLVLKIIIATVVISFCSWLSGKKPQLAGFIVALPITTLLVLIFSHFEFENTQNSVTFAKSIFVGIPVSLLFFVPFLVAGRLHLGFWSCYLGGLALLVLGYFLHKFFVSWL